MRHYLPHVSFLFCAILLRAQLKPPKVTCLALCRHTCLRAYKEGGEEESPDLEKDLRKGQHKLKG